MNHVFTIVAVVATLVLLVLHVTGSFLLSPIVILSPLIIAFLPAAFACALIIGAFVLSGIVYLLTGLAWLILVPIAAITRRFKYSFRK